MRSERAGFLDRRERRANDESSPFSALGENGRGFDATAPSLLHFLSSASRFAMLAMEFEERIH